MAGTINSNDPTNRGIAYGGPAWLSGNTIDFSDSEIIKCTDWAINNGANVINWSFGADTQGALSALSRYGDYVVRNRHKTLTVAAGNISNVGGNCSGSNYVSSPGTGFNMITVGSYVDQGTITNDDDTVSTFSCYEDPISSAGDRQKPEVAAPGVNIVTTCNSSPSCFRAVSGTSFASPITAGCAALLMQRKPILKDWPESIKAVLMASAVINLEGDARLSEKDRAGGIECDSADDVLTVAAGVETRNTIVPTRIPVDYFFRATAGQTVRVVIAWNSSTDPASPPTTDVLATDFGLYVYDPNDVVVTGSDSFNDAYEIVEFVAPSTGIYKASILSRRFDGTSEQIGFAVWRGTLKNRL